MKTPKLIKKASQLLGMDNEKRCERKKCIKEVLSKLKKKERALKEKLKKEKDKKHREIIKSNIAIIFAQRKKGITALKELKTLNKNSAAS